jgi:hypothetical protein
MATVLGHVEHQLIVGLGFRVSKVAHLLRTASGTDADLTYANLTDAKLTKAIPTCANLWGTSWCTGSRPNRPGGYVCKNDNN